MNLAEDIYKISRKYINESINRSVYPKMNSIRTNLNLEFGEDWRILLPEDTLESWFNSLCGLSFLILPKEVEEIIIHNERSVQYYTKGDKTIGPIQLDFEDVTISYKLLCLSERVDWNISTPFVSFNAKIHNSSARVSLTHSSLSEEHSHKCSIRFHSERAHKIDTFFHTEEVKDIIVRKYIEKKNIIICGSTGSGKTSLLSTLLSLNNEGQHIFVIEDTLEIKSPNTTTTRLVANEKPRHSLSDYCSYALRMRPERIVLGEIRSHEVVPLILSTNTGHKGILTTLHANSTTDSPRRLSTLLCLYSGIGGMNNEIALDLITKGIDIIIFMKNKKVEGAIELLGHEDGKINYDDILESKNEFSQQSYQYLR